MAWQPIDTAPKDGTRVILLVMDDEYGMDPWVLIGSWAGRSEDGGVDGWKLDCERRSQGRVNADMWMPLPEVPEVEWSYKFVA